MSSRRTEKNNELIQSSDYVPVAENQDNYIVQRSSNTYDDQNDPLNEIDLQNPHMFND